MRQEVLVVMSCMFYTSSSANDYSRIGKRSFFTTSKENTYPRLGRSGNSNKAAFELLKRRFTAGTGGSSYPRLGRSGFFTKAGNASYPRLGRSSECVDLDDVQNWIPERDEELPRSNGFPHLGLQAPIAFFVWDKDSDGHLSKLKFLSGLSKIRHRSHKK